MPVDTEINFKAWEYSRTQLMALLLGIMIDLNIIDQPEKFEGHPAVLFIEEVASSYSDNPYHSFLHCVDVTYFLYWTLKDLIERGVVWLNTLDIAALIISAIAHDSLHPGSNNNFQVTHSSSLLPGKSKQ